MMGYFIVYCIVSHIHPHPLSWFRTINKCYLDHTSCNIKFSKTGPSEELRPMMCRVNVWLGGSNVDPQHHQNMYLLMIPLAPGCNGEMEKLMEAKSDTTLGPVGQDGA
jgi:hypothetical protein